MPHLVRYISTRGDAEALNFADVLLAGLASDGGLYVPETYPHVSLETIASFAERPFAEVAARVIAPFLDTEDDRSALSEATRDVYADFGHPAVAPLVQIDANTFVLELFHGPTLAFKDVAMRLLARLAGDRLRRFNGRAVIVGATSGDTGGAAIAAFRGSDRADVFILFPRGRVSDVQRRMMTTVPDPNIHALSIDGTFDDCQALVKAMFGHDAFRRRVPLTAVNSINWARIAAQIPYYFTAAAALGAPHRKATFVVPTGNFGDIFAGWVASRMGLAVARLVIASNANDILPRAYEQGVYETRGVTATASPSMDIQVSSNFERFLFEAHGRNAGVVRDQMQALAREGRFGLGAAHGVLRAEFAAAAASEGEVAMAIREVRRASGYLMDPHTACGYVAARKTTTPGAPVVLLATAHPAKFPDAMAAIVGERPPLPPRLASLLTDPERVTVLPNDRNAVEAHILQYAKQHA